MGRVLRDLGVAPSSEKTMRRTLARCVEREYRDKIATACFARAFSAGDLSLVLYDVTTTLYFEAEKEDDSRKVGYPRNAGSTHRSWSVCWSTGPVSPRDRLL
jgi:hypothetical protein